MHVPGVRMVLTVLAAAVLLAAAAGLLLHAVPTSWQVTVVATSFARYLMWLALPAAFLAGLAHRWPLLAASVVACGLVIWVQAPSFVAEAPPGGTVSLEVLQANLKVGAADPAALVSLVRDHGVQVLATEELTTAEKQRLIAAGLADILPYRLTATRADGGVGIWSRYPLSGEHRIGGFELGALRATVTLPGQSPATFVAVHVFPPYPFPAGEWSQELARLRAVLDALPQGPPVVVAGDFNATVDHVQFRRLLGDGYGDAAAESGAGYTRTYPSDRWYPPLIGIDHVLTRGAVATRADTVDLPGSDHRGLLVQLALPTR